MLPYKPIQIKSFDIIRSKLETYFVNQINDWTTGSIPVESEKILVVTPELKSFLDSNNLIWDIARFFVTEPNSSIGIHIDGTPDYPKFLALNLPILNCNNTLMHWWDNLSQVTTQNFARYSDNIRVLDGPDKICTHSLELISPHLVRIDLPHSVNNNNKLHRLIFSLRFKPEPLHIWY